MEVSAENVERESMSDTDELEPSKIDWSTPYDEWLIPLLNRARHCGPIEFRAIPSAIQKRLEESAKALSHRQTEQVLERLHNSRVILTEESKVVNGEIPVVFANNIDAELKRIKEHL